jgi:hypothetical protein
MSVWTSVEDGLPKVGQPVWIRTVARGREDRNFISMGMMTTQGGGPQWADVRDEAWYDDLIGEWRADMALAEDNLIPTHWMPLPLPPGREVA